MEKRDLYDINKNLTGETIYKGEPVPKGRYIIIVLCIIQNSKGEFLIQKRSESTDGKYGYTGGHAKSGETPIEAIQSEIKEELGIDIPEDKLELILTGRREDRPAFFHIYYTKLDIDIDQFVLQEEEVEFVEWDSTKKIKKLIKDNLFLASHTKVFHEVEKILK